MREHADPKGGYSEIAAAAMATGAPMPDATVPVPSHVNGDRVNGVAHGKHTGFEKVNGHIGVVEGGEVEVYTSGANVRSGAHWKADGPQRREYIRRWS